jgi:hypothetical protein
MKGIIIMLVVFFGIPTILGVISSYRAGVLPYQQRRAEERRRTLELIRNQPRQKTHYEAWEDDYMGRD